MSTPPEAVQDAANKLISALALDEDARDTVESALHDMWDAGREQLALIHEIATAALANPTGRLAALHRIRAAASGTGTEPAGQQQPEPAAATTARPGGPAFAIYGTAGRWEIHAADPRYGARPVTRAYGVQIGTDYTDLTQAEMDRDLLNGMWLSDGGRGAGIEVQGGAS